MKDLAISKPKILVIGGSGFVGGRLVEAARQQGYPVGYTYTRQPLSLPGALAYRLDLTSPDTALESCLADFQPQVVVYSALPPVLSPYPLHHEISVKGLKRTITAIKSLSAPPLLVFISTNTVFANGNGLYREDQPTDPHLRTDTYRDYALTKAEAEQIAISNWPDTLIARTSIVDGYDLGGKLNSRLLALVERLRSGQPLPRFTDRFISPTLVDNLVETILEIIQPAFRYRGVLHLAGSQRLSDFEYGRLLASKLGLSPDLITPDSIKAVPTLAGGPADASLSVSFTQRLLQTRLLNVEEQLTRIFGQ